MKQGPWRTWNIVFILKTGKINTEKGMPRFSTTGFLFVLERKNKRLQKENFIEPYKDHGEPRHYYFYSKNKGNKHRKRHAQVLYKGRGRRVRALRTTYGGSRLQASLADRRAQPGSAEGRLREPQVPCREGFKGNRRFPLPYSLVKV